MLKSTTTMFYISGIMMMLAVGMIKYFTGSDFNILSISLYFIYGGVIGILATTTHTSLIKNVAFGSVFFILLWLLFLPVLSIDSNNWIVKQNELIILFIIGAIFVEREFWNALLRSKGKKPKAALTFIGTILFLIMFYTTDIASVVWKWWADNQWFSIVFLMIWWPFLIYNLIKLIIRDIKGLKDFIKRIT